MKLNLGCGKNHLAGYINIDKFPENKPDVLCNLDELLPFSDNSVDYVWGCHVMEHIQNLVGLMRELWRVCKPNTILKFITPYGSSDDAWENPFHLRGFTEITWQYFNKRIYEVPNNVGNAEHGIDFSFIVENCFLVPYPEFLSDPELDFKKKHYRNIIRELQIELRCEK